MSELTTRDAMLERAVAALEKIKTVMDEINPVGIVQAFAGTTTPQGWLLCDGSAVSRTDYADLFAVIGETYGSGDGSTTFNLPNLIDKFVEGNATAGTVKNAGLPNITGDFAIGVTTSNGGGMATETVNNSGAFAQSNVTTTSYGVNFASMTEKSITSKESFDASRSSSIYGNSTTVQPPALTMQYIIKY